MLSIQPQASSSLTQSPGDAWLPPDLAEVAKFNEQCLLTVERVLAESRSKPASFKAEVRSLFKQLDKISPFPKAAELEAKKSLNRGNMDETIRLLESLVL